MKSKGGEMEGINAGCSGIALWFLPFVRGG